MSIPQFSTLTEEEIHQLLLAPAIVTVLIAGADKDIDKKEINWAAKVVNYRTFTSEAELSAYYQVVNDDFKAELDEVLESWSADASEEQLVSQLAALKPILAKLEPNYSNLLKASWRSLAEHIAKSDGGVLGFGSVNFAEKQLIGLSMLD